MSGFRLERFSGNMRTLPLSRLSPDLVGIQVPLVVRIMGFRSCVKVRDPASAWEDICYSVMTTFLLIRFVPMSSVQK